jgi:hypothetical protein
MRNIVSFVEMWNGVHPLHLSKLWFWSTLLKLSQICKIASPNTTPIYTSKNSDKIYIIIQQSNDKIERTIVYIEFYEREK